MRGEPEVSRTLVKSDSLLPVYHALREPYRHDLVMPKDRTEGFWLA